MSERKRTTLRMNNALKKKVRVLMRRSDFTNFTAFLEQLVRDEWDRRATTPDWAAELAKEMAVVTAKAKGAAEVIVANEVSGEPQSGGAKTSAAGSASAKSRARGKSRQARQ